MQLYLMSFHSRNLRLLHCRFVSRAWSQELHHFSIQRLEVENRSRFGVDCEAFDLHSLLLEPGLWIDDFVAVVFRPSGDEAVDVGAGTVAFQLVSQISQEASSGKIESVLRTSQVDDWVWKTHIFNLYVKEKNSQREIFQNWKKYTSVKVEDTLLKRTEVGVELHSSLSRHVCSNDDVEPRGSLDKVLLRLVCHQDQLIVDDPDWRDFVRRIEDTRQELFRFPKVDSPSQIVVLSELS